MTRYHDQQNDVHSAESRCEGCAIQIHGISPRCLNSLPYETTNDPANSTSEGLLSRDSIAIDADDNIYTVARNTLVHESSLMYGDNTYSSDCGHYDGTGVLLLDGKEQNLAAMLPPSLYPLILVATLVGSSSAKLFTSPSQLPKTTYDYIIIGAGTAGNVVAARLTEDPKVSVLVLEAGVSNEGVLASMIPVLGPSLTPGTPYDWNYTITPQTGLNGRSMPYSRGKMLGGCSSINYMAYSHGSSDDYERYASLTGDLGWNWDNTGKYRKLNEKFIPPVDGHDPKVQFTPEAHSFTGEVSVSPPTFPNPLDERVMATTKEFPDEFPFIKDTIGGDVLGMGWLLSTIKNGTRSSSATAYLQPALSRDDLDVLINAHVTKLIQTGVVGRLPSFHSVQFAEHEGVEPTSLTATKEIILSAGTFGTPTILQLSGIGDQNDLEALSIKTIVNNPSVGRNMSDHVMLSNPYLVNSTETYDTIFRDPNLLKSSIAQWEESKTGFLAGSVSNQYGWFRLPSHSSIFDKVEDPSPGLHSSHFELIFLNMWVEPTVESPPTGNYLSILTNLITPTSRGEIKLSSNNPFDAPLINPNLLATDFDIFAMKEAVRAAKKFVSGAAWKDFIIEPFGAVANTETDEELEQFIRNHSTVMYHATGTASMSPKGADWGVVDPDLKVKGVEGLRIIDGSVLPFVPNAHPQGPIYILSERGADLIKQEWESRSNTRTQQWHAEL